MNQHRKLVGLLVAGGLIASMAATASADDFTTDNTTNPIVATKTVNVSVTAVGAEGPWDKNADGCNIGNVNDSHTVTANITSSDPFVASVDHSTMTFGACGVSQPLVVSVHQQVCTKTATITIAKASVAPSPNAVKGVFTTETLNVQSVGSLPTDPSCTSSSGGGSSLCSEPAAPAWAAAFLKASGYKANTASANYISEVAHFMGPQTDFNGVPKSATGTTVEGYYAYANAVRSWMGSQFGLTLKTVDQTLKYRPGFECASL